MANLIITNLKIFLFYFLSNMRGELFGGPPILFPSIFFILLNPTMCS